jgi:hypothetical protein
MKYGQSRSDDVIIQTMSATRHGHKNPAPAEAVYDAVIYSELPLNLATPSLQRFPDQLRGLPLRGVEQLRIQTKAFNDVLASFVEGEKGLGMMRDRMLETMSAPLRDLLTSAPLSMRIWWSNLAPELDELPWELTVEAGRRDAAHQVAFLRGVPPENPIPPLALEGTPRLGMIGAFRLWPAWAHDVAGRMGDSVKRFDGPFRQSLASVISEGVEFVHAFTDGIVSSALEGILFDHAAESYPPLTPTGELSQILSSSRVVVLALSPAVNQDPDTVRIGGREVLGAYRSFTYIGTSPTSLPTILAPLGPVPDDQMARFWIAFYEELSSSWHLTESLRRAQARFPYSVPIALFSRHSGGKLFRHQPHESQARPLEERAELLKSESLTRLISQIGDKYGIDLPNSVQDLVQKENGRQAELRGNLDAWTNAEAE